MGIRTLRGPTGHNRLVEAPEITSREPGSFPWRVLHQRHPAILARLRSHAPDLDAAHAAALAELEAEFTSGAWDRAPFLRAENYFYRRILEIIGYFEDPHDPFGFLKQAELADPSLPEFLDSFADDLPALLAASVWGNRADLSFRMQPGASTEEGGLVRDDRPAALQLLSAGTPQVALFTDNAGRELLADLFLVDHLLTAGLTEAVELHVKPYPYFVSDVIPTDLPATLERLESASGRAVEVAQRLRAAQAGGRLVVRADIFHVSPMSFNQMPPEFEAGLALSGVTILKGDLNYRRLVGDRRWPPTKSFAELTEYFPTAVLVLRTLKSEVITGLDPATVAALDATGEDWRTTGTHGLIQLRPPH